MTQAQPVDTVPGRGCAVSAASFGKERRAAARLRAHIVGGDIGFGERPVGRLAHHPVLPLHRFRDARVHPGRRRGLAVVSMANVVPSLEVMFVLSVFGACGVGDRGR